MESIEDRKSQGRAIYRRIFDDRKLAQLEAMIEGGEFGSALATLAQEFAFGSVWSRPGLEPKLRSVATIAVLIALGKNEELKKHIQVGLNLGISDRELEELIIQTVPYGGFPAASQASKIAAEVLAERTADI